MALPSSGEITLLGIRTELGGSGEIGLIDASTGNVASINTSNAPGNRPNQVAPHEMTEFYAYDHSAGGGGGPGDISEGAYPSSGVQIWSGNQGTSLQTDSVDLSSASYVGQSVVGESGHMFFRFDSGTSFRSDAQIAEVLYNNGSAFEDFQGNISGIKTTSVTTTSTYPSSGFINLASGTTQGRWNQLNGTPASGGTGVNGDFIYYESSGNNGKNKKVWLKFPLVTFTHNTVTLKTYGYGSNMGTLYFGVYMVTA